MHSPVTQFPSIFISKIPKFVFSDSKCISLSPTTCLIASDSAMNDPNWPLVNISNSTYFFLWENIIFRFKKAYLMLHLMNKTFLVGRLWSPESRLSGNYQKIFLSVLSFCFFSFFDLRSKSSTSINLICIENTEIDCPRRVKPISFFIWTPSEPMNGHFLVESYERDRKSIFKFWIRSEIWFFMHVWSTNFVFHFWSDLGPFSNCPEFGPESEVPKIWSRTGPKLQFLWWSLIWKVSGPRMQPSYAVTCYMLKHRPFPTKQIKIM